MFDVPLSMLPKPLEMEPQPKAPTVVNEDVTTHDFSVLPETALADTVPPLLLAAWAWVALVQEVEPM